MVRWPLDSRCVYRAVLTGIRIPRRFSSGIFHQDGLCWRWGNAGAVQLPHRERAFSHPIQGALSGNGVEPQVYGDEGQPELHHPH